MDGRLKKVIWGFAFLGAAISFGLIILPVSIAVVPTIKAQSEPVLTLVPKPRANPLAPYNIISEEPLFTKTRQAERLTSENGIAFAENIEERQPVEGFELLGVLISADQRRALIRHSDDLTAHWYYENSQLGGWGLVSIEKDKIILEYAGDQRDVLLKPKNEKD